MTNKKNKQTKKKQAAPATSANGDQNGVAELWVLPISDIEWLRSI